MNIKPELPRPGLFRDRREAGRLLAAKLTTYVNRPDVIVLGLPRGCHRGIAAAFPGPHCRRGSDSVATDLRRDEGGG
jgi:hypothetical protein